MKRSHKSKNSAKARGTAWATTADNEASTSLISCPSETCSHASKSDTKARGTTWATTADDIYEASTAFISSRRAIAQQSQSIPLMMRRELIRARARVPYSNGHVRTTQPKPKGHTYSEQKHTQSMVI